MSAPPLPIVFLAHATDLGGAELATLAIMEQCRDWGHPLQALVHRRGPLLPRFEEVCEGRLLVQPLAYPRQPLTWLRLPTLRRRARNFLGNPLTPLLLFSTDFLSLWSALHLRRPQDRLLSLWQGEYRFTDTTCLAKWCCYGARQAHVLCASAPISQHANQHGLLPHKVHALNPYVDTFRLDPARYDRHALRLRYGLPETTALALCLGRIGSGKGQLDLARAFVRTLDTAPPWSLWIVGPANPEEARTLEALAAATPDSRLRWLGPQENIPELLHLADAVLCPGRLQESFGLVPVEATLMRKPLLAYRTGALPQMLGEDHPGLLPMETSLEDFVAHWHHPDFLPALAPHLEPCRQRLLARLQPSAWRADLATLLETATRA